MTFEEAYQQIRKHHYEILDERESISKSARLSLSTWVLDILTECRDTADTPQTDCDKCIWNVCNYNRVDWDADTPQTLPKDIVQPCGNGNVMMSEDTYEELLQTDCPWK